MRATGGYVKRFLARQNGQVKPGQAVPGTGAKDTKRRKRSSVKMQPYERPRKGGGRHSIEND